MLRAVLLLLCLTGFLTRAWAYPIPPRPLRMLVSESQYIVVGHVIQTFERQEKKTKKNRYPSRMTVARIAVLECLQGKMVCDTIELEFNAGVICPAPPMYFAGTRVLCFLNEDEEGKLYTHALSYGAKTLTDEEIVIYKTRIGELQEILSHPDKKQQHAETLDWLVSCAEQKATRWEGTFELRPESHFMSYYSAEQKETFGDSLSAAQKQRLYRSLQNGGPLDYNDFGLIDLVYKGNEAEVDALLLTNLKALPEDDYWTAEEYIQRLRYRNLTADMRKTMEDFEALRNDINYYEKKQELKAIIDRFIRLVEPL